MVDGTIPSSAAAASTPDTGVDVPLACVDVVSQAASLTEGAATAVSLTEGGILRQWAIFRSLGTEASAMREGCWFGSVIEGRDCVTA